MFHTIKHYVRNKEFAVTFIFFHIVFLVIAVTNLSLNKWFLGWDSISPELNTGLNITRAFSALWQENYGVGTIGGHGFAATLPHTFITAALDILFPTHIIRSLFTLFCFYIGGLGVYTLSVYLLKKIQSALHKQEIRIPLFTISLAASFFYWFNLASTQQFAIQLEAFIVHYAALPWLFFSVLLLLEKITRKRLLFFILINVFAVVQGFIPSLFIAYGTALVLFLCTYIITHRMNITTIKKAIIILVCTFCLNAFWFLPVVYFTLTNNGSLQQSYNNTISTPEFIEKSQKYGDLADVALLKGFYWQGYELGNYIFQPFHEHHANPLIPFIGYFAFGIIILGGIASFFQLKTWFSKAFTFIGLYFFAGLAVNTIPFSFLYSILQTLSPTFYQAFRTTFTKFSLGAAFSYSILFAFGLFSLYLLLSKLRKRKIAHVLPIITIILLVLYALPLFQGNFFYNKLLIDLPKPYQDVISFFNKQPNGRIADFPQDCPEGWYGYKWGYFGSGFYWYGIKQPFLSRAFDIWNPANEAYYWEVTHALRQKDFALVDKILDKYNVLYLLYDPNFIHCRSEKGSFTSDDFLQYIQQNPQYSAVGTFDDDSIFPIHIFKNNLSQESYIDVIQNPDSIGPTYSTTEFDQNLQINNFPYITKENQYDTYVPFRTLLTTKQQHPPLNISTQNNQVSVETSLPSTLKEYNLSLPAYSEFEKRVPVDIHIQPISENEAELHITYQTPHILLNNTELDTRIRTMISETFSIKDEEQIQLLNNGDVIRQSDNNSFSTIFSLTDPNTLRVTNAVGKELFSWNENQNATIAALLHTPFTTSLPNFSEGTLQVIIPTTQEYFQIKKPDIYTNPPTSCSLIPQPIHYEVSEKESLPFIRMISYDQKQCYTELFDSISTEHGYVVEATTRNIKGAPLFMHVTNKNRPVGVDIFLQKNSEFNKQSFIIPPSIANEIQYDVTFENANYNGQGSINDIQNVSLYRIPYAFLKQITVQKNSIENDILMVPNEEREPEIKKINHPFSTFYTFLLNKEKGFNTYLALYQGFDSGWKAYTTDSWLSKTLPFLFGTELKNHVLVNNWANGWELPNEAKQYSISIFFLPQLLQWIGFGLLLVPFGLLIFIRKK